MRVQELSPVICHVRVLETYTRCIFQSAHAVPMEYISAVLFTVPRLRGATLVHILRILIFAQPVDPSINAVYGCVFVTGIVSPENVELSVLEEIDHTYIAYVVTVVPETQSQ